MASLIEPNAWAALRLPSGSVKLLQVVPNSTISLGKYGAFPSDLLIRRPYHVTYELQDRRPDGISTRLRVVPTVELYADIDGEGSEPEDEDRDTNGDSDRVTEKDTVRSGQAAGDLSLSVAALLEEHESAAAGGLRGQTLTATEIEALRRDGTDAGQDLVAKLIESHTGAEQKTAFSLAKYKLLKERKFVRRFSIVPMDVYQLNSWFLNDKDPSRVLEMREEMVGLLACWGNVRYGGQDSSLTHAQVAVEIGDAPKARFLVVDDTCGLLTAAMAERMGILQSTDTDSTDLSTRHEIQPQHEVNGNGSANVDETTEAADDEVGEEMPAVIDQPLSNGKRTSSNRDFISSTNTITLVHAASQPNLNALNYFNFDSTHPNHAPHPLNNHLLTLTWLQLLDPSADPLYTSEQIYSSPDVVKTWKAARRSTYYRKRRRWTRLHHTIDDTRAGNFSGLVVASTMDPISIVRSLVPLLAGGAPVAIYSPSLEPLTKLADCFSIARRSAWVGQEAANEIKGRTPEELENWPGSDNFPINPTLLLGTQLQTSRVRKWQVLPGRTHPVMTAKGGAEGYIFTAWRAIPAEGKIEARGKFQKRRKMEEACEID